MKKVVTILVITLCFFNAKAQIEDEMTRQLSRFFQISLVTVDTGTWQNLVVWQKVDTQAVIDTVLKFYPNIQMNSFHVNDYFVMRYDSASATYQEIWTQPAEELTVFLDESSFPEERTYKYKLMANISYSGVETMTGIPFQYTGPTLLDSCRYHKTLFIEKELNGDTLNLYIDPYQVERLDMRDFFQELLVKVYRHTDSIDIFNHLYDSVYYMVNDTLFTYSDPDTTSNDSGYYYVGVVELNEMIDPNESYFSMLKASGGPFSRSISNLEDNRLKENPTIIQQINNQDITLEISPNPVTSKATIVYSIPAKGLVRLSLYSAEGRKIRDIVHKIQAKGQYTKEVSNTTLGAVPGINYLVLSFNENQQVKKIIQLKE
jgi:hypothetical protein